MILYTVKNGVYYNLEDFKEDLSDLGENGFPNKIYINMTNRCSCSCTFCLEYTSGYSVTYQYEWFIRFGVRRTDCKPTCRNF